MFLACHPVDMILSKLICLLNKFLTLLSKFHQRNLRSDNLFSNRDFNYVNKTNLYKPDLINKSKTKHNLISRASVLEAVGLAASQANIYLYLSIA